MAIELITLWGHTERLWGYEIRAIFREEGSKDDINVEMTFPKEPDKKAIDAMVATKKEQIEKQFAEVPVTHPKDSYTKEEVTELVQAFKTEITAKEASVPEVFKDLVSSLAVKEEPKEEPIDEGLVEVKK